MTLWRSSDKHECVKIADGDSLQFAWVDSDGSLVGIGRSIPVSKTWLDKQAKAKREFT